MSYQKPQYEDPLRNYFRNLTNFYQLAPHLLNAKTEEDFEIWLEKLEAIDRRSLFLYLRENKDKIDKKFLKRAQRRFVEKI